MPIEPHYFGRPIALRCSNNFFETNDTNLLGRNLTGGFMKSLFLAIMLIAGLAQAQLVPGNGDGHGRPGRPSRPSHPQPAPYPGNPYEPGYPSYPNNPYEPGYPSYPGYSDYGPAYTYRWLDMGTSKVDKFMSETIRINAHDRLVNEVLLRSSNADVQIIRAYARLSNGRTTNIATGVVREGRDVRVRLDYQYSVRVDSIEIEATSPNVIGSRARLQIWLGLAE